MTLLLALVLAANPGDRRDVTPPPHQGRHRVLIEVICEPSDPSAAGRGAQFEYGWWDGGTYHGRNDWPAGYYVWVRPCWYVWQDRD